MMLPDLELIGLDQKFPTPHVLIMAKIYAGNRLYKYLDRKIQGKIGNKSESQNSMIELPWTGSKANLVELIYAICESGEVRCNVAQLTRSFETIFNIDLGNIYKTYEKLRMRKKNRTPFLDNLRDKLDKRMKEYD